MIYCLILLGVLLNTAAQLLLKAGMNQIGHFEFNAANVVAVGLRVMTTTPIIAGLFAYVVSVGVWLLVLSRVQVSFAYPMLSIGYVVNAIAAYYLFGEPSYYPFACWVFLSLLLVFIWLHKAFKS